MSHDNPIDRFNDGQLAWPTAHVVLVAPEIAGNTGNVIRLCANTGAALHLVRPLGFVLDDARMRRAGLDYHERTSVQVHDSFDDCLRAIAGEQGAEAASPSFAAFTARGTTRYDQLDPATASVLVFGCEATGLPDSVLLDARCAATVTLPMAPDNRSLNLANTVAITVFDRWRQLGFPGAGSSLDRAHLAVEDFTQEALPPR